MFDGVASDACDAGIGRWMCDVVKVGVVKGAGKEWYGVVASRAKPRGTNVSIPRHGHLAGVAY